jgi:hypothetical protein
VRRVPWVSRDWVMNALPRFCAWHWTLVSQHLIRLEPEDTYHVYVSECDLKMARGNLGRKGAKIISAHAQADSAVCSGCSGMLRNAHPRLRLRRQLLTSKH